MILVKNSTSGEWEQVAGGVSNSYAPIGAIFPFGGSTAPSGYLMCNGQAVSRTDYSALFAVIGTSFGAGDGSTTFNIPDLREATTKGVGLSGKSSNHYDSDGVALGEFVEDRVQDHSHQTYIKGDIGYPFGTKVGDEIFIHFANADTGEGMGWSVKATTIYKGNHGATTEVKAVGVNYIIKAKDVNLSVGGQTLADRVETLETTTSGDISGATTNSGTITSAKYVRSGNVVQLRLTLTGASLTTHGTTTLVVTMPSTVPVPVMTVDGVANAWNGSVDETGHVRMSSGSRDVVIYSSNDSGSDEDITDAEVWSTVTYITAD